MDSCDVFFIHGPNQEEWHIKTIVYFQIVDLDEKKKWFQCYLMVGDRRDNPSRQSPENLRLGSDITKLNIKPGCPKLGIILGAAAAPGPSGSRPGLYSYQ